MSVVEDQPLLVQIRCKMKGHANSRSFNELLRRRVPIFDWLPQYSWGKLLHDSLAGTTVGLTVIPQGIAYASVAGLPAQYGLYSSFMGCFVYLVFGSAKDITIGPTAIMGLLTQPYVLEHGPDFAVLLCFLAGCIMTTMGLLHVGFLVDFISMPVICGFTNAAAIIIGSSQISTIFGIPGRSESFLDAIYKLFAHYNQIKLWDTLLGFVSICLLVFLKNLPAKRSGNFFQKIMWLVSLGRNAVVVLSGMILAGIVVTEDYQPIKITGNITEGLPPFGLPPFSSNFNGKSYDFMDMVKILNGSLVSVALIAFLEHIAIAKAFAKGRKVDANQEMIALGLSNVFGSFVRSMPTSGSFTRTAVNHASGVKTTLGGVVTGILVLLACGLLTSTFKYIPKATLAAVIIVAMYHMLEFHICMILWKTKKVDLLPLMVTWIMCLCHSLEVGTIAGIVTNLALVLYDTARPKLLIEDQKINGHLVLVVSPNQFLSFPAAEYLREQVMTWCDLLKEVYIVVLDGRNVSGIDATVAKNLSLLRSDLENRNQRIFFWNWRDDTRKTLVAFDTTAENCFRNSSAIHQVVIEELVQSGNKTNSVQVEECMNNEVNTVP